MNKLKKRVRANAPMIVHYNCPTEEATCGSPEFQSTQQRSDPDEPEDNTICWKCTHCDATVGVETLEDGSIVIYI